MMLGNGEWTTLLLHLSFYMNYSDIGIALALCCAMHIYLEEPSIISDI
jgi:hypothetical protein